MSPETQKKPVRARHHRGILPLAVLTAGALIILAASHALLERDLWALNLICPGALALLGILSVHWIVGAVYGGWEGLSVRRRWVYRWIQYGMAVFAGVCIAVVATMYWLRGHA